MRLIDADALKETLRGIRTEFVKHPTFLRSDIEEGIDRGVCAAIQAIDEAPTIDAVPVAHAQPVWINPLDPGVKACIWTCSCLCSICGEYVAASWKYCPHCGAKMDDEWREADADTP